jgi:Zn-dependent M28 family amino/carboxypeptidase
MIMSTSLKQLLQQVSVERIRGHISTLEGIRHPVVNPNALDAAADYIWTSLRALGYPLESQPFRALDGEYRNIIATLRGARYPEERVMVVAHYDTVGSSPGADDNASGVAVLLELATILQPARFDRTVQFVAVNLEERQGEGPLEEAGLIGSRALANAAQQEGWQIEGVIVLESIAYAGEAIPQSAPAGLPVELPEAGDFIGVIGNEASAALVQAFLQATGRYRIPLPVVPLVVAGRGEMLRHTRRSDHAPFWDRGYRAVMLTDTAEFRNPNYHQPTDTLDTLNLPFVAEVCRAVAAVVADLAGDSPG